MDDIPVWSNENLYPSLSSSAWLKDKKALQDAGRRLLRQLKPLTSASALAEALPELLKTFDKAYALAEHLGSAAYLWYSTNTRDETALKELNSIEELSLPLRDAEVRFSAFWGRWGTPKLLTRYPELQAYRLFLEEATIQARHQMSEAEEALAADMLRSGGDAWGRLQEALSSTLTRPWEGGSKTVTELRALASSPDRSIREKAFQSELEAWASAEVPLAAALNGVKGQAVTLNNRRKWPDPVEQSAQQSRLSRPALEAMLAAMQDSLPVFRRYLALKARLLGVPKCAFFDLFAPVGSQPHFSFDEARQVIRDAFTGFSPAMGAFADLAFERRWIHARPQEGKVGGAYCINLPLAKEPRIFSNFDGSFGEVKTLAHELGHGWHYWLLRHKPQVWRDYPMTLAETASIFAETVLQEAALKTATGSQTLFMLEQSLQDSTQVIVDILSRYTFEKALFQERQKGELSPRELSQLMLDAQKATYGDGLDEQHLHPYMWAVKGHYYHHNLAFYNYPYAFGQLFGLGLYARARDEGPEFARTYQRLLEGTGILTADQLAREAGFDLTTPDFWHSGLKLIASTVEDLERRSHEN
ncbi:MAG: M3 family oligoendopeptidase [Spirochaetales bacterium]|nr:M3 family oligoendopeptidase [Spirochaetales bacterium]